jgi:hypothetical protein
MQPGLFKASDDMQTVTKRKEEKENIIYFTFRTR